MVKKAIYIIGKKINLFLKKYINISIYISKCNLAERMGFEPTIRY